MKRSAGKTGLFLMVTNVAGVLSIVLGAWFWSLSPSSWQQYWETADGTLALLGLFLGLPAIIAILWAIGFVCGALALTSLVSREDVQRALLASPYGGHLGRLELLLLSRFKSHDNQKT
jgi:hypothetical protein